MIFQSYVTRGYPLHDILPHHLVPFPLPELFELGQDPFYWWTITTEKWYPSHIFPNSKVPQIDTLGIPISRAISGKISSNTIAPKVPIRIFRGGSCWSLGGSKPSQGWPILPIGIGGSKPSQGWPILPLGSYESWAEMTQKASNPLLVSTRPWEHQPGSRHSRCLKFEKGRKATVRHVASVLQKSGCSMIYYITSGKLTQLWKINMFNG